MMPKPKKKPAKRAPAKKEVVTTKRLVYQGVRFDGRTLHHLFSEVGEKNYVEQLDKYRWLYKPKYASFILGRVYAGECTDEGAAYFSTFDAQLISPALEASLTPMITLWSLLDAAARKQKHQKAAYARLKTEKLRAWRDCVAPIRLEYLSATTAERRVIRSMLLDELLGPGA